MSLSGSAEPGTTPATDRWGWGEGVVGLCRLPVTWMRVDASASWVVSKMRRISWYVGVVVGLVLLVAAPVLRWGVAPAVTKLPSDTNTIRIYTGSASTVINPSVAHGTLFGPALLHDQPVTVQHQVTVTGTSGDSARIADSKKVSVPGTTVANVNQTYAVDRKTLGRGSGFPDVTLQTGQTFNWPIHTAKQDYVGWVSDTQSSTPLRFTGTADRDGIETYVFTASVPTSRITDPAMLSQLPGALPKSLLSSMVPSLGLTMDQLQQLADVLPQLPDPVPFGYLFSSAATYWVAPDTGIVVDVVSHEVRTAAFVVGSRLMPVGAVLDFTYSAPASTVHAAGQDAKNGADKMQLISTTLPLVALITGGVIVLAQIATAVYTRRRTTAPPTTPAQPRELTTAG
jgi:hypothetical protein